MAQIDAHLTTGLTGFDRMLKGLIPGDNLVWRVEHVDAYRPFVPYYRAAAAKLGQPLIYFRFAEQAPLLEEGDGVEIHRLDPDDGFEAFLTSIHRVIEKTGRGGYYLFDCLSGLAEQWHSDQMLGNFFRLTCPYLYDVEAIAYFALLRDAHSLQAMAAITDTTQILLDIYRHRERTYVHPWKVQARFSPTMHMLHVWDDGDFRPVTESATIAEIRTSVPWSKADSPTHPTGVWNRTFARAEEFALNGVDRSDPEGEECFQLLLRTLMTRDERIIRLADRYLTLKDLVQVGNRMVGTGLIGGKSVGMLLARAILRSNGDDWGDLLEPHDSFFIGSDAFYTFLVANGIWWVREKQKNPTAYLEGAERARQRMLIGSFPDDIARQLEDMLDYFGQSPIIVRSSSLLEDNFGNAFAGKYESVFCSNQGSRHQRLEDFLAAVRTIYASTMSEKALTYRAQRGLLEHDEQMALLVQRVSGRMYDSLYFPQIAGVGLSVNPYCWSEDIDRAAGMMRLVFGLGTRAVDRSDDDYTRVVALNAPQRRPEANFDEVRQYSQRKVDVLDLESNQLVSRSFRDVASQRPDLPLELLASKDTGMQRRAVETGRPEAFPYVLTFDKLFENTNFVTDVRRMLQTLQEAYDYPVDVEFTANFFDAPNYKINIVQCRPLQVAEGGAIADPPADLPAERVILNANGAVIGQSRISRVDRIVFVDPQTYGELPVGERHNVARLIGRLNHLPDEAGRTVMLIGPGRWGTTTPSLGVPVRFSDIDTVSALCEVVTMRGDVVPDVSLGTHFFNELIETDILYFALFPSRDENTLNAEVLRDAPNRLDDLLEDDAGLADTVRVIDLADDRRATLNANVLTQRVVCYTG